MTTSQPRFDLASFAARLPIVPLAIMLSCLFSLVVILQNPLLNDDAYGYLRAAEVFNDDGARAVLESFGWYHYSILIALLDHIVPGDLVVAAHVFNTAMYALLTHAFLLLARELRATPLAQFFAALCILVLPLTNEMRYFLIRDTGFWAFAVLSLVFLIRFARSGELRHAAQWSFALAVATAFRLEALLLMALVPWTLLLPDASTSLRVRARRCGQLVGILAALVVAILLLSLLAGLSLPELIAYAYRWYLPRLAELPELLKAMASGVGEALFTPDNYPGSDHTAIGIVVALFAYALALVTNLVNALSLPLALVLVSARLAIGKSELQPPSGRMLQGYIAVAALALLMFVVIMQFLTQRYATLLTLLVLALLPPALDDLYARVRNPRRFHGWLGFVVFYYVVDSLVSFGYAQTHVEDAIAWTRTELPADQTLKTNNFAIAYRSGRVTDYHTTQRDAEAVAATATSGDVLVLEVDRGSDVDFTVAVPDLVEVERFANERGDEVRVYRYR
ncbi:MAG: hypothetical protein ACO1PZ_12100 [Gammaproteobacteria bacterium]